MLKKILKYTFRTLLVILLVLILVPALLYIPAVQDFVRSKAVGYASRTLGMDLSVERLRLSFPLRLSVDNTLLTDKATRSSPADTFRWRSPCGPCSAKRSPCGVSNWQNSRRITEIPRQAWT